MNVFVGISGDQFLMGFQRIAHFHLRHIAIATEGPLRAVRPCQRDQKIVDADQPALRLLPVSPPSP
jgi:hypothetical protein